MGIFPDLGGYPQTTARDPSQRGANKSAIPQIHRAAGVDGNGNGSQPPVFAPAPCSISATMGSKVLGTQTSLNPVDHPPARGGFSDTR
jgi:hypothetical protein